MKRFWDKVKKTKKCWIWMGADRGNGYGCLRVGKKIVDAHRISWKLHFGEIPSGKLVCHHCDNRKCVNPKHLFLGTYSDNMQDASRKGRIVWPRNFKNGHIPNNRKLNKEQVLKIRKLGKMYTKYSIARHFGVDEKAIRLILKRETYKNI